MICSFLILLFSVLAPETTYRVEVINLSAQFKVFKDGEYVFEKEAKEKHKSIYFYLDGERQRGNSLEFESTSPCSLFINGMLAGNIAPGTTTFKIDSLSTRYSTSLSISLYRENPAKNIQAKVIHLSSILPISLDPRIRQVKDFSDFSILASGLLLIVFVFLLRANSRVTWDYFNVVKLLSLQEREETTSGTKISASFNLLIYLFGCFLTSLLLLILHHQSGQSLPLLGNIMELGLWEIILRWVTISIILFGGLFVKLIILYSFSRLFNFGELLTLQFLNFVRLIFFACALTSFLLITYLVFEIQNPNTFVYLINMLVALLLLWLPLVFFKLLSRASNKMFHLFSYLCPSEIFPVLFLIKVLFF
jgi:hypothetical protein